MKFFDFLSVNRNKKIHAEHVESEVLHRANKERADIENLQRQLQQQTVKIDELKREKQILTDSQREYSRLTFMKMTELEQLHDEIARLKTEKADWTKKSATKDQQIQQLAEQLRLKNEMIEQTKIIHTKKIVHDDNTEREKQEALSQIHHTLDLVRKNVEDTSSPKEREVEEETMPVQIVDDPNVQQENIFEDQDVATGSPYNSRQLEVHTPQNFSERKINEKKVLQNLSKELISTFNELNTAKNETISTGLMLPPYSASSFLGRTHGDEQSYLEKVLSKISTLKKPVEKIAFDSTYGTDYASAYAEGIIRKHKHGKNRMLQMIEDSPYIARVDFVTRKGPETMYIGEQGIAGSVVSWKSEAASLYYLRMVGQPIEHKTLGTTLVDYSRQIDITRGTLSKLHPPMTASGMGFKDEGLVAALSGKKGLEMTSIVATLQREQYEIIRLPIAKPIIIQGSAGSGKSAIALHRISYLLYKYDGLTQESVAFLGPNEAFLSHIQNVLPALGEFNSKQTTFKNMACDILEISPALIKRHAISELDVMKVKGSLEFRALVQRVVMNHLNDLRRWTTNPAAEYVPISIVPIMQEIEKYPAMTMKERRNLYFNVYIKSVQKEIDEENERREKWKNRVRKQAEQIIQQNAEKIPLFEYDFISNEIMLLGKIYLQKVTEHAEQSTDVSKKRMQNSRMRFITAISDQVQQKVSEQMSSLRDSMHIELDDPDLAAMWERKVQLLIREQRETMIVEAMMKQTEEVLYLSDVLEDAELKRRLDLLHEQLSGQLPAIRAEFFASEEEKIVTALLAEVPVSLERYYHGQISKALKTVYGIAYSFQAKQSGFSFAESLELSDKKQKELHQYVLANLEIEVDECYRNVLEKANGNGLFSMDTQTTSWRYEDLPALLHINRLLHGQRKEHMLSYLIIDEAQDYMPYEITELYAMTRKDNIMMIGDLGQNLNPASTLQDWNSLADLIGDLALYELEGTYRSTAQIVNISNRIIKPFAEGKYALSTKTVRDGEKVTLKYYKKSTEEQRLLELLNEAIDNQKSSSVAVIVKDESRIEKFRYMIEPYYSVAVQTPGSLPEHVKVIITTPQAVKGLEFEAVIITRFHEYKSIDADRKAAYVAASRALHVLQIMTEAGKDHLLKKQAKAVILD